MKSTDLDLKIIVENVSDHVVYTDTKGYIKFVNQAFLKSTGYKEEEVIGKGMNILKSGFHDSSFYKGLWATLLKGEKFTGVLKNKKKNGDFFWINKTITPVKENGIIKGFLSVSSDFSSKVHYEEKLKEEHDFSKAIIDTTKSLIFVKSPDGVICMVNRAVENLTGYKKEELIGRPFTFILSGSRENVVVENHSDDREAEVNTRTSTIYWKTKSGEMRLISCTTTAIKGEDDSVKYFIGTGMDITEEYNTKLKLTDINNKLHSLVLARTKDLEEKNRALLESEKRLEEAQRIASLGNWDWNIITNDLFWSDETFRIFGLIPKEFVPTYHKFLEYVHPDDVFIVTEGVEFAIKGRGEYDVVHRVITPAKEMKYVRERGEVYYNNEGKPVRMLGTVQDITMQRKSEIALQQSEYGLAEAQRIAQVGNWSYNYANGNVFWSDEVYRIFGEEKDSFKLDLLSYLSKIHPCDTEFVQQAINNLLTNKVNYNIAHRIVLPDGNSRFIRCKSEAEILPDGTIGKIVGTIQNIHEQKLAELKMQHSHATIENSMSAIFNADLEGNINYANKAAAALWGFSSVQEMIETWPHVTNYWSPESIPNAVKVMEALKKEESILLFNELQGVKRDGTIFYPIFNATVLKDENNKVTAFIASFFDMSEKIQIERELQKYHERLKFIFTCIDEIIYAFNISENSETKGELIFISDSVERILGYKTEDFLSEKINWKDLIHPDDLTDADRKLRELCVSRKPVKRTFRMRNSKNEYVWLEDRLTPDFESSNNSITCYGSSRDISDRIYYEQALELSTKKYKGLYTNALVGIFRTNIQTQRATEVNEVCINLFGYNSREDFMDNFYASRHYVFQNDREQMKEAIVKNGFLEGVEIKFVKVNGEEFWGQLSAKYIPETMEIEGFVVDITKRMRYKLQLEQAVKEKELLLKELHHRVKNNLQIISGLLLLQINKTNERDVLEHLNASRDRIMAISLVHEKLYQSKSLANISIKNYLEDLINIIKQTYTNKKVVIKINITDINLNIESAIPLGLIFQELISNSYKYAFSEQENGEICIEMTQLEETNFFVAYRDNGKGFDTKNTDLDKSLGIKLMIGLVQELKGELKVSSEAGKGFEASFIIIKKQ